jgi:hypothetical protein
LSRSSLPASPQTRTASSTGSAITHRTRFRSTASPSPISKARSSPTSFPPTQFSRSKSSLERPPAEYGGKTSLVIVATTRSGQGITTPTGSVYTSYGSFGSATGGFDLSYGQKNWGNFVEFDALNTGRFLDPPEFTVFHDKGNEENIFDRVDYTFTPVDSVHVDLNYSRSWFQTPNAFQNLNVQNVVSGSGASPSPVFGNVGNADQRSFIGTFNIYPTYTRVISNNAVFNLGAWVRKDQYGYFPSGDPLADLGPSNLQAAMAVPSIPVKRVGPSTAHEGCFAAPQ